MNPNKKIQELTNAEKKATDGGYNKNDMFSETKEHMANIQHELYSNQPIGGHTDGTVDVSS
jgi:hypothetical protein